MSRRTTLIVGLSSLAAAIVLGILVRVVPPGFDTWAVESLYVAEDSGLGRLATAVSGLGTLAALGVAVFVLVSGRSRLSGALLARYGAVLVLSLVPMAGQYVFQRPGPPRQPDWTYPSGHATVIAALVLLAAIAAHRLLERKQAAVLAIGIAAFLATGVARIALAEHYPTDLAGSALAVLGIGLTAAAWLAVTPSETNV